MIRLTINKGALKVAKDTPHLLDGFYKITNLEANLNGGQQANVGVDEKPFDLHLHRN
jgi:hypothetical protein